MSGIVTDSDGRRIAWLARGPEDGRPVLYFHGQPGSRLQQRLVPEEVLERFGVRLISFDRPGYGDTDPLPGDRIARSRDALAVADHLGIDRFAVMSMSAGGSYSVVLAAVAPERVEKLVLVSAQMPYDDVDVIATLLPDQLAMLPFLSDGRNELIEAGADEYRTNTLADPYSMFTAAWDSMSPPEQAMLADPAGRADLEEDIRLGLSRSSDGMIDDLLSWTTPYEVDVASIRCPVVAVHGSADDWEPISNLRRILALLPQAELLVVEGRNHFGPFMYPDLVVSLTSR